MSRLRMPSLIVKEIIEVLHEKNMNNKAAEPIGMSIEASKSKYH